MGTKTDSKDHNSKDQDPKHPSSKHQNSKHPSSAPATAGRRTVVRVQTGVRLEKRMVKVLKGLAEYHDMTLGDLMEGIVLHAFDGQCAFGDESLAVIADLKRLYGLDLASGDSHLLTEEKAS